MIFLPQSATMKPTSLEDNARLSPSLDQDNTDCCPDCGASPHDVFHLFNYPSHPIRLKPLDMWSNPEFPENTICEFSYLVARNLE